MGNKSTKLSNKIHINPNDVIELIGVQLRQGESIELIFKLENKKYPFLQRFYNSENIKSFRYSSEYYIHIQQNLVGYSIWLKYISNNVQKIYPLFGLNKENIYNIVETILNDGILPKFKDNKRLLTYFEMSNLYHDSVEITHDSFIDSDELSI